MIIYLFDNTFEGLLTSVFDAYSRRIFPDALLAEGEPLPLFYDESFTVISDEEKSGRVWRGLEKKLSSSALSCLAQCWLAEEPETASLLFRSIETNFADPDVLEFSRMWKRVDWERIRMLQFIRFQKAADGTFFAAFEPQYNALPLTIQHFKDRFADQKWIVYDMKRRYGFYYTGMLDESLMDENEKIFQKLWKTYFKAICIKERMNPRKHKKDMPVRYWKYLTEKQGNEK